VDTTIVTPFALILQGGAANQWPHDFPMAIIPPGWSFTVQDPVSTEVCALSFFWEAIFAEELDYLW
jgi:hypothetical protein